MPHTLRISEYINVNGTRQFLSVRSNGSDLPILLYLHGGPGDAALPLVTKYNSSLEEHFTVVVWEQRGAGKSYYPFGAQEEITISMFVEDVYAITEYLLTKYNQKKIYLVGHSWGSVLGLIFCKRHPEKIHTYIGCGQVVNMRKSSKEAYEFALSHAGKRDLERLKRIDCTYRGEGWLKDLLYVTRQVVKHKGSLYGKTNYNELILPFLFSKDYTLGDLIRRQKGSLQAIQYLWQELMEIDFEAQTKYEVPILFVEGRYDSHVSSALARTYFERIETTKQFYWFEKSCHFPQWSEPERFHSLMCGLLA